MREATYVLYASGFGLPVSIAVVAAQVMRKHSIQLFDMAVHLLFFYK